MDYIDNKFPEEYFESIHKSCDMDEYETIKSISYDGKILQLWEDNRNFIMLDNSHPICYFEYQMHKKDKSLGYSCPVKSSKDILDAASAMIQMMEYNNAELLADNLADLKKFCNTIKNVSKMYNI